MSTYVIGDLQGCYLSLQSLLRKFDFQPGRDRLWFAGDLVNRGPHSLECLRFIRGLGQVATVVLGNHDLHLLAVAHGVSMCKPKDTLEPILCAPDANDLIDWLRHQKLLHRAEGHAMVHAGLLPEWDWATAQTLSLEVEQMLQGEQCIHFLSNMYGDKPDRWHAALAGLDRLRIAVNAMTRMRVLQKDGRLDLRFKGAPDSRPENTDPWFARPTPRKPEYTLLAGHWSALGLYISPHFIGLDTGCLWGGKLTALRIEDHTIFQVPCMDCENA